MNKYDIPMDETYGSIPELIMRHINNGSDVLEFGCATGRMTKYMSETKGCNVSIIEIDNEAYNVALKYAGNGFCGDADEMTWKDVFKDSRYDVILFADVIEHLRNPIEVIKNAMPNTIGS